MSNEELKNLIIQNKCFNIDIENLDINIINELLYYENFFNHIIVLPINIVDDLVTKGLVFPIKYIRNNSLIEKYISIYNIELLRSYIEHIKINNIYLYNILDKKLIKKCDYIFSSIDNHGIFNDYNIIYKELKNNIIPKKIPQFFLNNSINNITNEILIDETKNILFNAICDKFFKDYSTNVLINIKNILNFDKHTNIIPYHRKKIYYLLLNYKKFDTDDLKQIYSILNDNNVTYFYTDIRNIKNISYQMINNKLIDLSKLKYEIKDGIKIYKIENNYYLTIHTTQIKKDDFKYELWKKYNGKKTLSISIIDNNHNLTYTDPKKYASFGINKIPCEKIVHVYNEDSYSNQLENNNRINMITTIEELMDKTNGYNEIVLLDTKFDYLVCYNNFTNDDIKICKSMNNLPIVVVKENSGKSYVRQYNYKKYIN